MNEEIRYLQLSEIVPGEIHPHLETNNENLHNIINSIKKYGIITPLLVRPKGNMYEIVLGNRRYKAAQELQLKQVPVIIKELDDKQALEMIISDNIQRKELTTKEEALLYNQVLSNNNEKVEKISNDLGIPLDRIISKLNTLSKKVKQNIEDKKINNNEKVSNSNYINNDIINLSELNKKESEREDKFMNNNESLNNQSNQNNMLGQDNSQLQNNNEPTFGGKFFPSLEDQPTNMNLNTNILNNIPTPTINSEPTVNNGSNLIDLTDLSGLSQPLSNELNQQPAPTVEAPMPAPGLDTNQSLNNDISNTINEPLNTNDDLAQIIQSVPSLDSNQPLPEIPSLESDSTKNLDQQSNINNNLDLNIQPALSTQEEPKTVPLDSNIQNSLDPLSNFNNNIELNPQPTLPTAEPTQEPSQNILTDLNNQSNLNADIQQNQTIATPQEEKNIIPVVNMIKNLVIGLESLGYNIKLEESEEEKSYKLQIEVEK